MYKTLILFCALITLTFPAVGQEKGSLKIPITEIKKTDGSSVSTGVFNNGGKPYLISFWATWCKPCVAELNAIAENYADWQKETGIKVIAISVDDSRSISKVGPFVNGKNWDFEVYVDPNGDFKRAMNVNNVPHTFLINAAGEIIWQHNSYSPGTKKNYILLLRTSTQANPLKISEKTFVIYRPLLQPLCSERPKRAGRKSSRKLSVRCANLQKRQPDRCTQCS